VHGGRDGKVIDEKGEQTTNMICTSKDIESKNEGGAGECGQYVRNIEQRNKSKTHI
jgi:hypothetical protein